MPDSPPATPGPAYSFPEGLLPTLLAVSLSAVNLLRPLYDTTGEQLVDFHLDYLNPAAQRMTGLPEQPGTTALTRFPELRVNGVFDFYVRTFRTGEPATFACNYQADGLDNYFQLAAQRCGDLLVVSFTDTRDQPRPPVEEALRQSQAAEQHAHTEAERQRQRFREVLTQLPAYVAVYQGPDHIYQFVNPPYQSRFPHRSFLGRPFREATPESAELGVVALFDQVYQTGQPVYLPELEGWFDFHGTGQPEQIFLNLVLQPLRDVQGRIDGVLDFSYNITEQVRARRQAEQLNQELEAGVQARTAQLQEQQSLMRQILSTVPAAIATLSGPAHRFSFANARYQHLVGNRVQVGLTVGEALPEVVEQGVIELLDRVYQTGEPFLGNEIIIMLEQPPGPAHQYAYNLAYLPLHDGQGQVQGILVFAVEVSEQVQARRKVQHLNQELHTANARLTQTNADLDTFVYTASHDLKAPITNIEGILGALRETLPAAVQQDEVTSHLLGLLDKTVHRFLTTLADLTDIARLQRVYDEPVEQLVLAPVVADVLNDLAPLLAAAAAQVQVVVPAGLAVSFAPGSLRSIVYNLLSNAVKYRDPARPAQVTLRAEQRAGGVHLTVQDNGLGLTESQQQRLFQVFQRLHTHVEGTGVGLYMIKRLIDNAGARISVESEPGVGSTFTVTFPA